MNTQKSVRLDPRNRLVLSILLGATFVVFLNETILGVALPRIMAQLHIEASTGQWLSTAYMLTMAIIIPITGFLLLRFSTRQMFITSMLLFSVGTLLGGLAPDFSVLLIGRIVQAASTAIMMPLLMTSVMELVPEAIRGRIMGLISVVMSVAPAIGPAVSGLILSVLDWRWLFWLILPLTLSALLIGIFRMTNVGDAVKLRMDALSVVLSAFAFSGLILGLSGFAEQARGKALINPLWLLAGGAILLVFFIWRQLRLAKNAQPLLDLRVFRSRTYTFSVLLMVVAMFTLFGLSILTPIFAQTGLGLTPLTTGLLLLPGGLIMGLLGPVVGRFYDRWGARALLLPGSIATSGAMWVMTTFNAQTSWWPILLANVVLSIGLALLFTPLFTVSMSSVPAELYSHSSAVIGSVQQLAGAAGTALFVTVLTLSQLAHTAAGATNAEATVAGAHIAYLVGAAVSVLLVVFAFFVKAPASREEREAELAA